MRSSTVAKAVPALTACLAFFAAVAVPRAAPGLVMVAGALALFQALGARLAHVPGVLRVPGILREPAAAALLVLTCYLFINSSWALDQAAAFEKSGLFLALTIASLAAAGFVVRAGRAGDGRLARFALAGLAAGLVYLLIEVAFDQPVLKFILNHLPGFGGISPKHVSVHDGRVTFIQPYVPNRNVTAAVMLFWPSVLMAMTLPAPRRRAVQAAIALLTVACVALADSGTAVTGLAAGIAAYAIGLVSVRALRAVVLSIWVTGMALALPLGAMPDKLGWTEWAWLPQQSVAARFYIWRYTAEKARENLIGGIGIRSTRELQEQDGPGPGSPNDERFRPRPGRHAHNAFLQIWLELGAIGAAIVTILGAAALLRIGRLERTNAMAGYAMFVSICGVAAFGFGIWQTWLLATVSLSVLGFLAGIRARRSETAAGNGS